MTGADHGLVQARSSPFVLACCARVAGLIVGSVRVSLLGPLLIDDREGGQVLGAAKERSLLAALALAPGSSVSTEALVAALWGDSPPVAARKTLQTYVWNLRQAFGDDLIATTAPGYSLQIVPEDVDVGRFRTLATEGGRALAEGELRAAREALAEAAGLWRGEPFGGVASHSGLAAEAVRLGEELLSAVEGRITADLALGRHDKLVGEL